MCVTVLPLEETILGFILLRQFQLCLTTDYSCKCVISALNCSIFITKSNEYALVLKEANNILDAENNICIILYTILYYTLLQVLHCLH